MHVFVYMCYMHVCAHMCGGVLACVYTFGGQKSTSVAVHLMFETMSFKNLKLPDSASKPPQAYDSGTRHATTPICMWVLESKFRASHWATATFPTE